jgi:hypothetical protein
VADACTFCGRELGPITRPCDALRGVDRCRKIAPDAADGAPSSSDRPTFPLYATLDGVSLEDLRAGYEGAVRLIGWHQRRERELLREIAGLKARAAAGGAHG